MVKHSLGLAVNVGSAVGCMLIGCAAGPSDSEPIARERATVCSLPDATTAAVAELAATIGIELHRWELLTDFQVSVGYGGRPMLGLTAAGLAQCGGSCPLTSNILTLQDQRTDQSVAFGSYVLSAGAFASQLTSGFANQSACATNGQCPYEAHVLTIRFETPGTCRGFDTYLVAQPGGGNLNSVATLSNALYWTESGGPNPLIGFQSTADSVTIDPTGGLFPAGQAPGGVCQVFSRVNLTGTPCTCAANNVYSNGQLINDQGMTPNTYYCRQVYGCQVFSRTSLLNAPCECDERHIFTNGRLVNDQPLTPSTYYCRELDDRCQVLTTDNIGGDPCTCSAFNVARGNLSASQALTPDIYYCR